MKLAEKGALVALLLQQYYDPMYEYQLSQRAGKQLLRADRAGIVARARSHT